MSPRSDTFLPNHRVAVDWIMPPTADEPRDRGNKRECRSFEGNVVRVVGDLGGVLNVMKCQRTKKGLSPS